MKKEKKKMNNKAVDFKTINVFEFMNLIKDFPFKVFVELGIFLSF